MICDNCTKVKVCKYKENCNILERDVSGSKIENIITLEIKCNQFEGAKLYRDDSTMAQVSAHNAFVRESSKIASILGI